jgi:hypothetical protein
LARQTRARAEIHNNILDIINNRNGRTGDGLANNVIDALILNETDRGRLFFGLKIIVDQRAMLDLAQRPTPRLVFNGDLTNGRAHPRLDSPNFIRIMRFLSRVETSTITRTSNDPNAIIMFRNPFTENPTGGLSDRQIRRIPCKVYNQIQKLDKYKDFDSNCPICYDEFLGGDMVRVLKCSHFYHQACVDGWLKQKNSCPLCKEKCA